MAGASRGCVQWHQVPSALGDPVGFAEVVRLLCRNWQIEVLIPIADESILASLDAAANMPARIPFPSLQSFSAVSDKAALLAAAKSLNIAVPEQHVVMTREQLLDVPVNDWKFPLVVKPARSVSGDQRQRSKYGVDYALNLAELRTRWLKAPDSSFPLLVQQRIVGPGTGVFVLMWDGRVRAVFAHRRLREKPPTGGVSVYCESVAPDARLVDQSVALLKRFDWQGVAMVEFKTDAATGVPYLMEVNGRFWGSLQLAIDAGVDFPRLLVDCLNLEGPNALPPYLPGVRSRWWWGDVDQLLLRLRQKHDPSLLAANDSRAKAVAEFLPVRANDRSDVFRVSDPGPFMRETVDWLARR